MTPHRSVDNLRGATPTLPFELALDDARLRCTDILRHLPGKRLVCMGTLDGREVVAKIYVDPKRAKVHAEREARGARAMLARGIRTAPLLAKASIDDAQVIVYERIVPAQTAMDAWAASNRTERVSLFRALAETVAHHHNAGLLQHDLHLGNFLLCDQQIYTLDAAEIRAEQMPIARPKALDNLALLCAQLPPEHDGTALAAFADYARARQWETTAEDRTVLKAAIATQRNRREHLFLRKIFRESSAFACRRRFDHYYVCDRRDYSPAMRQALENPETLFEGAQFLKRGNTATVAVTHIDGHEIVIKRYNIKNPLHALKRAIQPTRAAISWRNAHRLRFYDIATPRPIALVERRIGPLRRTAYFITEFHAGEPASVFFRRDDIAEESKTGVAAGITTLIRQLRSLNLSHGDMKATNFLIAGNQPALIDLDAMRKHRDTVTADRAVQRDIQRFMLNWANEPAIERLFRMSLAEEEQSVQGKS